MPGPVQADRPKGEARDLPQVGELSKGHRGDGERRRRLAPTLTGYQSSQVRLTLCQSFSVAPAW